MLEIDDDLFEISYKQTNYCELYIKLYRQIIDNTDNSDNANNTDNTDNTDNGSGEGGGGDGDRQGRAFQ